MLRVRHADAVLHDLLSAFYLLHDAHQLPGVLGHFVREGADAVGHVQDGGADLVRLGLQNGVLKEKKEMKRKEDERSSSPDEAPLTRGSGYLVTLVLAVLLAHAAHEGARLARLLQADELDGVDLVLRAQRLLVRLVGQRHAAVLGQRAGGVGELGALGAQVGGAHGAVHGGRVALVLVAADYTLVGRRGRLV